MKEEKITVEVTRRGGVEYSIEEHDDMNVEKDPEGIINAIQLAISEFQRLALSVGEIMAAKTGLNRRN